MSALKTKHVMLRHLGLANKVVVVDECHAYDAYMSVYLDRALKWLGAYGVPVIIMSATLPYERRNAMVRAYVNKKHLPIDSTMERAYPLITYTDGGTALQHRVDNTRPDRQIMLLNLDSNDITATLENVLSDRGCAGLIINTVKEAQELYSTLHDTFGDDVILLHSQFTMEDRTQKEETITSELGKRSLTRPLRRIVIGTQLLEQSLDIDFDVLITEMAPIDLLVQRIGRLHRHSNNRPAKLRQAICYLLEPSDGSKAIYGECLLMRTEARLAQLNGRTNLPGDIPALIQDVYDLDKVALCEGGAYDTARETHNKRMEDKKSRAEAFLLPEPVTVQLKRSPTILGLLDTLKDSKDGDYGDKAVRDIDETIEVMLIRESDNDWLDRSTEPDTETANLLHKRKLRLPHKLSAPYSIASTIEALEKLTLDAYRASQDELSTLKGSLFLPLGSDDTVTVNGVTLGYSPDIGLYEIEENANAE